MVLFFLKDRGEKKDRGQKNPSQKKKYLLSQKRSGNTVKGSFNFDGRFPKNNPMTQPLQLGQEAGMHFVEGVPSLDEQKLTSHKPLGSSKLLGKACAWPTCVEGNMQSYWNSGVMTTIYQNAQVLPLVNSYDTIQVPNAAFSF